MADLNLPNPQNNIDLSVPSVLDYTEKAYAPADEALKSYVMAMRGQQKPLDVYSQLETEAGLPQMKKTASTLRENIGNLEDTIRRVEPNISATTRNSLVTEGQRAGMVEARQKPLLQNLGTLTTGLGRIEQGITAASQGIDTKTGLFIKGQEQELQPYQVELTAMQDRAARMVSGFTADNQNNLQVLLAKWNRQNELNDREVDQAFELLKLEKGYNNEISKMKEQTTQDVSQYKQQKVIDQQYKTPAATTVVTPKVNSYYSAPSYYGASSSSASYSSQSPISKLWSLPINP